MWWQLFIAGIGIVGLLLLWTALVVAIAAVVLYVVSFVPIVTRPPNQARVTWSDLDRDDPLNFDEEDLVARRRRATDGQVAARTAVAGATGPSRSADAPEPVDSPRPLGASPSGD